MQKKFIFLQLIVVVITCSILTNCKNHKTKKTTNDSTGVAIHDPTIAGNFSTQTKIKFDSIEIVSFLNNYPDFKIFEQDLYTFYNKRKYAVAWFDENGMIEQAANLYNRIQNISDEGLPDSLLYKAEFTKLMEPDRTTVTNQKPSTATELMLTAQYLQYAKAVWEGVSEEESLATDWLIPRKKVSYQQLLDSLATGKDMLNNDNAPVYRQYALLKSYLKKYRDINAQNKWQTISADKKSYKLGDSSVVIGQVRENLFLSGDIDSNNQSNKFDKPLQAGVKAFQQRYGYTETGIINATVITQLNFPLEKRIEQIMVNMERSRWVPVEPKSNYLIVNIPEYKLHVYEDDTLAWDMNVVVGKDQNKTVVFNGDIKYIVFSPYWNVPTSILKAEIEPGIAKNPNYLAEHNMERIGNTTAVRQKPGLANSLGLVKFLFPNSYNIYLHDSPAKSLFSQDQRAFSHGCIRVAEPKKLAEYFLRNDSAWSEAKIDFAMKKG
ncbi:MAG: L,D-transpeptidase family protein, partial [Sphingobacteriales bacterium]|nr:L,D-transpeptidase family protein [Sphingobacteriales bacterium]